MNEFLKRYRSILNTMALVLMLVIPLLLYSAALSGSFFLTPGLVILAVVMLYILKNG